MNRVREVVYYKHYFREFYDQLGKEVQKKIDYVLFVITIADRIPAKFFKHVEDTRGLYEVRIEYGGNIYRVFCCLDEGKVVVLFNGFQKKSQKTPQQEIDKALLIMTDYLMSKPKRKET